MIRIFPDQGFRFGYARSTMYLIQGAGRQGFCIPRDKTFIRVYHQNANLTGKEPERVVYTGSHINLRGVG
jgi:hypothetical protein